MEQIVVVFYKMCSITLGDVIFNIVISYINNQIALMFTFLSIISNFLVNKISSCSVKSAVYDSI